MAISRLINQNQRNFSLIEERFNFLPNQTQYHGTMPAVELVKQELRHQKPWYWRSHKSSRNILSQNWRVTFVLLIWRTVITLYEKWSIWLIVRQEEYCDLKGYESLMISKLMQYLLMKWYIIRYIKPSKLLVLYFIKCLGADRQSVKQRAMVALSMQNTLLSLYC